MDVNNIGDNQPRQALSALSKTLILYAVIAAAAALFSACVYDGKVNHRVVVQVSFWVRAGVFIAGTVGGTIGMMLGRFARDLVRPDFIITGGGMSGLVKARLFWALGPQLIGMLAGLFLSAGGFIYLIK